MMSVNAAPALRSFSRFAGCRTFTATLSERFRILNPSVPHNVLRCFPCRQFRVFHPSWAIRIVSVPPFAESVSEGDIVWKKAVGDLVKEDEVIAEIETDKTSVPVPAPCSGTVKELLVDDGGKVVPGQEIFKIEEGAAPTVESSMKAAEAPKPAPPAATAQPPAAPAASAPSPPASKAPSESHPVSSPASFAPLVGQRAEQRIKMSRMRLRIAQRLKDAQNTCAMLTTFNEIDMSNLIELRQTYKEVFQKRHGVKLGIMSTFAKASAVALKDQPAVNAVIDGGDIIYRDYVDISIAVATPKGLVVPVIRNVDSMNYFDIEREIVELGNRARDGKLAVEDMDGGTFTISNGGIYGSLFGTPIINPPQSAILGLYGVFDRPVARNKQVVIRPMMYAALTYDHRLIDGREAVTFLRKVKEFVEDPRTFFLQL
ncbi:2-oxoglutarate dehydrogenase E2 component (dihydrolipoamide succinyltransferase) [Paragonimus westermani]|uniref:Dihydrolipoyllysine-residue succinyltransferase component of 2-oxoglutarate dehydrogenase complex, mitochondrial n=1 Tax=Paragonimus westermani TaxID=34504 RepID=A0A5J4NY07_9TREM|nr:2-oxoglutarate dehydrogenase E2 component (dihydrolipoamide succinyltransferase) [Paragonimus westermani]